MGGTHGSGFGFTADDMLEMSGVHGVRGVGGVCEMCMFSSFFCFSSGCLTGSWSVWSHAVTPHSTIYHLVFVI